jgi:hypothetical protein
LFQRDVDGCWFINMFEPPLSHWNALVSGDNQGDRVAFLEQVRGRLTAQIESSKSELAHASKVRWAVNYFNVAATQLGAPTIETDVAASGSA